MYRYVLFYLILINCTALGLYGLDKKRAVRNQWRIPEKTLLGIAVLGGGPGALLGMRLFRHKTRKPKFYIGIPVILILETAAVLWILK